MFSFMKPLTQPRAEEDLNFSILKNRTPKDVVQQTRCFLTFQQQKKENKKSCAKLELFGENQIGAWGNPH